MIKTFMTRFLLGLLVLAMAYFAFLSTEDTSIPITNVEGDTMEELTGQQDTTRGKGVTYSSFNLDGEEIVNATSENATQQGKSHVKLEEGLSLKVREKGKTYHVEADSLENLPSGRKIMYAKAGGQIVLSVEDGTTIRTPGPLVHEVDGIFSSDAAIEFSLGAHAGSCRGLRYLPESYLDLLNEAVFNLGGEAGAMRIEADRIHFDYKAGKGELVDGVLTMGGPARQSRLEAQMIELYTRGELSAFLLDRALLQGGPASFTWGRGDLESSLFDVCFASDGRRIDAISTGWDAAFKMVTDDGYWLDGKGGSLTLLVENSFPRELTSKSPIIIDGYKGNTKAMELRGKEGVQTTFVDGSAYSTRIFGSPTFRYGARTGQAGNLRVLHAERNILFSEGAELREEARDIVVRGDEILLTNWDGKEQEIFASNFVEIIRAEGAPEMVRAGGSSLKLRLPEYFLKLQGEPARIVRADQNVRAENIEVLQVGDEWFDLKCETKVELSMTLAEGPCVIEAARFSYRQETDVLDFEDVIRAELPGRGHLSAGFMKVMLSRDGEGRAMLKRMTATKDVVFKGTIEQKGEPSPFSCVSEEMDYLADAEIVHFKGNGKDVTVKHPSGDLRGRKITYNLRTNEILIDAQTHGTTTTTIPIEQGEDGIQ